MRNLDLYQARIEDSRKLSQSRHRRNKVETFQRALDRSYNSTLVEKEGSTFQALITGIPTSPIITKKNFATHLKHNCEVGDTIYWKENDSHWIITEHDSTEMAIFQGSIQKCLYELVWQDPKTNEIYKAWAAAKGPEETTITDGVKHSIFFDKLTDSLYLIIPQKTPGAHLLRRYFQLMLGGRKWEIEIVDDITRTELMYIDLKEVVRDRNVDSEELAEGKLDKSFIVRSALDAVKTVKQGFSLELDPVLIRNGYIISEVDFDYKGKNCTIKDNKVIFDKEGEAIITIREREHKFSESFAITVERDVETVKETQILGAKNIMTLEDTTIRIIGAEASNWFFDEEYFKLKKKDGTSIVLTARNKTGTTIVSCETENGVESHLIKIVPLFGGR